MNEAEQQIIEGAKWFNEEPDVIWNPLLEIHEKSEPILTSYFNDTGQNLRDKWVPALRDTGQHFVDYSLAQFMWSTNSRMAQGAFDDHLYNYESGTYGTGIIYFSEHNLYIKISAKFTRSHLINRNVKYRSLQVGEVSDGFDR